MRVYIIRHGETDWNKQCRLQGQSDISLNENGIRLAQITAKGMASIPFDFVYSSPLRRSMETARLVLGDRKLPVITDERLREISFGSWEGLRAKGAEIEVPVDRFRKFYEDPWHFENASDGESIPELVDRLHKFYQDLVSNPDLAEKTVLVSTHGCALRALLQSFDQKEDYWRGGVPLNCAVTIADIKDGIPQIIEQDHIYYDKSQIVNHFSGIK